MKISTEATHLYEGMLSISGDICPDRVITYTKGDCWILAKAMHEIGAGDLVTISPAEGYGSESHHDGGLTWYHMAIKLHSGYILDAQGLTHPELMRYNYGPDYEECRVRLLPVDEYEDAVEGQPEGQECLEETYELAAALVEWVKKLPPLAPIA